jgi:hypothetical protein
MIGTNSKGNRSLYISESISANGASGNAKLLFRGKRRSSIYGEESTGLDGERLALRPGSSHA